MERKDVSIDFSDEIEERLADDYDVVHDYKESNGIPSSDPNAVRQLGSKSVNSLRLTEIAKGCGGLFKTPRQVTVPKNVNTYLVNCAAQQELETLNQEIDTCAMWKIEVLRPKVLDLLNKVYEQADLSLLLS